MLSTSATNVGLQTTSIVYNTLASKIYNKPYGSAVRETIANALDIHSQVGKTDVKVDVDVSSSRDLEDHSVVNLLVTTRDYGTGISDDKYDDAYTFFTSMKNGENQSGEYGLGAKSPYGILYKYRESNPDSDCDMAFYVTSFINGVATTRIHFLDDNAIPSYDVLLREPTNEPDGLMVQFIIPMSAISDIPNSVVLSFLNKVNFTYNKYNSEPSKSTKTTIVNATRSKSFIDVALDLLVDSHTFNLCDGIDIMYIKTPTYHESSLERVYFKKGDILYRSNTSWSSIITALPVVEDAVAIALIDINVVSDLVINKSFDMSYEIPSSRDSIQFNCIFDVERAIKTYMNDANVRTRLTDSYTNMLIADKKTDISYARPKQVTLKEVVAYAKSLGKIPNISELNVAPKFNDCLRIESAFTLTEMSGSPKGDVLVDSNGGTCYQYNSTKHRSVLPTMYTISGNTGIWNYNRQSYIFVFKDASRFRTPLSQLAIASNKTVLLVSPSTDEYVYDDFVRDCTRLGVEHTRVSDIEVNGNSEITTNNTAAISRIWIGDNWVKNSKSVDQLNFDGKTVYVGTIAEEQKYYSFPTITTSEVIGFDNPLSFSLSSGGMVVSTKLDGVNVVKALTDVVLISYDVKRKTTKDTAAWIKANLDNGTFKHIRDIELDFNLKFMNLHDSMIHVLYNRSMLGRTNYEYALEIYLRDSYNVQNKLRSHYVNLDASETYNPAEVEKFMTMAMSQVSPEDQELLGLFRSIDSRRQPLLYAKVVELITRPIVDTLGLDDIFKE